MSKKKAVYVENKPNISKNNNLNFKFNDCDGIIIVVPFGTYPRAEHLSPACRRSGNRTGTVRDARGDGKKTPTAVFHVKSGLLGGCSSGGTMTDNNNTR